MSGASILFDDKKLLSRFADLIERGENPATPLREIGEYSLISTRKRFDEMVDPSGLPWAPLEPGYQKSKKENADRILIYHGYLVGQLAYQLVDGGVEWGSNLVYAATQQFGRGVIHSRPYLGFSDEDRREYEAILTGYYTD